MKTLFVVLLLLFSINVSSQTLVGRVVGVTDGDTITLLDASYTQYKIRLAGIDAPEKKQPFGQVSKQSLSDLVYDKIVKVDWYKKDKYQRIIGKVLLNEIDTNLEQVKRGLAWHYTKYQKEQSIEDRESYYEAQEDAKGNKLGLWIEPNSIEPWEWRKRKNVIN
jgi:endonuclease YncB( thermonuclease family)